MIEPLKQSGNVTFAIVTVKHKAFAKAKMCSAEISLKEIEEGKVFRAKSVNDLFEQYGIDV